MWLSPGWASDWSLFPQARVDLGALAHDAPDSWLSGGLGKLGLGRSDQALRTQAQFGLDVEYSLLWRGRVHVLADAGNTQAGGRRSGLSEAFVERLWFADNQDRWRLRGGLYFLPTSMENVGEFWATPYTLTFSVANSWIAEEFRPLGTELSWSRTHQDGSALELAGGLLWGNDTAGALLAWRGFALHDRLGRYGETLPLPALASLAPGGPFAEQDARGSQAFGADLDGRVGYTVRGRWQPNAQLTTRAAWIDNRADRDLYGGDYAWRARFGLMGGEWRVNPQLTIIGEWLHGDSGMGFAGGDFAEIGFSTAYVLASWWHEGWRFSLRGESFRVRDLDQSGAEINTERGHAYSLAAFRDLGLGWRLGAEWLRMQAKRPGALELGLGERIDGDQLRIELRWSWEP